MVIKINGKEQVIEEISNLIDLVNSKGLNPGAIVVEHNLEVIPKDMWSEVSIAEGDTIEIVSFVGGG